MGRPTPRIMYDCQGANCPECERYAVCKSLNWNDEQVFTPAEKVAALREAILAEGGIDAVLAWFRELRDSGEILIRTGGQRHGPRYEIRKSIKEG